MKTLLFIYRFALCFFQLGTSGWGDSSSGANRKFSTNHRHSCGNPGCGNNYILNHSLSFCFLLKYICSWFIYINSIILEIIMKRIA